MNIEDDGTQFDALSESDLRFGSAKKFLADQGLSSIGFDNSQIGESGNFNVKKTGGLGTMSMDADNSAELSKLKADLKNCKKNKLILEDEIKVLEGIIDGLNSDIETLRDEVKVLEGIVNELKEAIKVLEAEVRRLNDIILLLIAKINCINSSLKGPDPVGLGAGGACWDYSGSYTSYNSSTCLDPSGAFNGYFETFGTTSQLCIEPNASANQYTVTVANTGWYSSTCPVTTGQGAIITFNFLGDDGTSMNFSASPNQTQTFPAVALTPNIPFTVSGNVYNGIGSPAYVPVGGFTPQSDGSGVDDVTYKAYVDVDENGNVLDPETGEQACP